MLENPVYSKLLVVNLRSRLSACGGSFEQYSSSGVSEANEVEKKFSAVTMFRCGQSAGNLLQSRESSETIRQTIDVKDVNG